MKSCFLFHKYEWLPSSNIHKCYKKCSKCGKIQDISYSEHILQKEGCYIICKRCRHVAKEEHQYEDVQGRCLRRCKVCGKEIEAEHQMIWRTENGSCERYCQKCGYTIPGHSWNTVTVFDRQTQRWRHLTGCKCSICGKINPDGQHDWKRIREGDYADIKVCSVCGARDESEKITLEEAERREALANAERDEAMRSSDSLSEMRSVGIKC